LIVEDLKKAGVDLSLIRQREKEETDLSVVLVVPDGGRTIIVSRGKTRLGSKDIDLEKLDAGWFHLSSLEGNVALAEEIVFLAAQKQVLVSWNPGGREISQKKRLKKILGKINLLILNQKEVEKLLDVKMTDESFWPAVYKLSCPLTAITQGRKGAWIVKTTEKEKFHQPAFASRTVEETGAGDAFCAGLVAGLIKKQALSQSLAWGLANGAGAVSRFGAKAGLLGEKKIREVVDKRAF